MTYKGLRNYSHQLLLVVKERARVQMRPDASGKAQRARWHDTKGKRDLGEVSAEVAAGLQALPIQKHVHCMPAFPFSAWCLRFAV